MDKLTQKEIARMLDRAAARADIVNAEPATPKQAWFLASLIVKDVAQRMSKGLSVDYSHYEEVNNSNFVLTKRAASRAIEIYAAA